VNAEGAFLAWIFCGLRVLYYGILWRER
jgi:hypothetical protein